MEIQMTEAAANTFNPIRSFVEGVTTKPNPDKKVINLGLGDPTVFNLKPAPFVTNAVIDIINKGANNGYTHSKGDPLARQAIAKKFSTPNAQLSADDVLITSGASHALYLSFLVLVQKGDNVLLPAPGFPLYSTICSSIGATTKHYRLLPSKSFEIDLQHMESLIDEHTKVILLNNPSNPCGSVYSKQHLNQFLSIVEKYPQIVVIADEIYANMIFENQEFHFLAELSNNVPVLSIGGMAKRFLVPGWRVGWVLVHDKKNKLNQIKKGLNSVAQLILSSNTLIHGALPEILSHPDEEKEVRKLMNKLESHANAFVEVFKKHGGSHSEVDEEIKENSNEEFNIDKQISLIVPQGAMYLMAEIHLEGFCSEITDERTFISRLFAEESVFLLPGSVLSFPNSFRVVICADQDTLRDAANRIISFCKRYRK